MVLNSVTGRRHETTLTSRNQDGVLTTWTYDSTYQLLAQQTANTYSTQTYDAAGNVLTKWEQGSNPMTFTYDVRNRIVTMLQGGTITTYSYGGTGYLRSETIPTGVTTYVYTNSLLMTGVRFADGTRSTYTYRADGKRRTAFEAGGSLTTFVWDGEDYLGQY